MVKYTPTICWLLPTNCLSVFDHFVGLALKGLGWLQCVLKLHLKPVLLIIIVHNLTTMTSEQTQSLHSSLIQNSIWHINAVLDSNFEQVVVYWWFKIKNKTLPSTYDRALITNPTDIYLFKDSNRNTSKRCEICLKLTIMMSFWCFYC